GSAGTLAAPGCAGRRRSRLPQPGFEERGRQRPVCIDPSLPLKRSASSATISRAKSAAALPTFAIRLFAQDLAPPGELAGEAFRPRNVAERALGELHQLFVLEQEPKE